MGAVAGFKSLGAGGGVDDEGAGIHAAILKDAMGILLPAQPAMAAYSGLVDLDFSPGRVICSLESLLVAEPGCDQPPRGTILTRVARGWLAAVAIRHLASSHKAEAIGKGH